MYEQLDSLCKVRFVAPYIQPDDYEKTVRFIESCIVDDKREILKLIETMSEDTLMIKETMGKIMDIKDRLELKKENKDK